MHEIIYAGAKCLYLWVEPSYRLLDLAIEYRNKQLLADHPYENQVSRVIREKLGWEHVGQQIVFPETSFVILDIWVPSLRLAIEVDGKYHQQQVKKDERRDELLMEMGIRTMRLSNRAIEKTDDDDALARKILRKFESPDQPKIKKTNIKKPKKKSKKWKMCNKHRPLSTSEIKKLNRASFRSIIRIKKR